MATQFSIYGSTVLKRAYCQGCGGNAFVVKGSFSCCGEKYSGSAFSQKMIVSPSYIRKSPPKNVQTLILENQHGLCFYCGERFGNLYQRGTKIGSLRICWDHYLPFAYCGANKDDNFVAACQICNGIKSDKIFETVEEAKNYVEHRRNKKGFVYLSRMSETICESEA
jgi:hypothetical protein